MTLKKSTMPTHGTNMASLLKDLPALPDNPRSTLEVVSEHLRVNGFGYEKSIGSLDDVLAQKAGSCLGLSVLVATLLRNRGKTSSCKVLTHPRDAVDKADKKLFAELSGGEYFDYDSPQLPKASRLSDQTERIHRFIPLGHPLVVLDGVPLETTLMVDEDQDPHHEFPAESVFGAGSEILESYSLSDRAKSLFAPYSVENPPSQVVAQKLSGIVEQSLNIFPDNRDALMLLWNFGCFTGNRIIQAKAKSRLLSLEVADSDISYKLWLVTGDRKYLELTLEQFPEHIPAFLDRRVFLEPDRREARMNLAVALWCIAYSYTFDLKVFYKDRQIQQKIAELFPR